MKTATLKIEHEFDRPLLGFPETRISLKMYCVGDFEVEVFRDEIMVEKWETASASEAMSIYHHPFAHGFEWESYSYDDE